MSDRSQPWSVPWSAEERRSFVLGHPDEGAQLCAPGSTPCAPALEPGARPEERWNVRRYGRRAAGATPGSAAAVSDALAGGEADADPNPVDPGKAMTAGFWGALGGMAVTLAFALLEVGVVYVAAREGARSGARARR